MALRAPVCAGLLLRQSLASTSSPLPVDTLTLARSYSGASRLSTSSYASTFMTVHLGTGALPTAKFGGVPLYSSARLADVGPTTGRRHYVSPSSGARKQDYYQLLGVSKSATADDIKKAYRAKARELHPDVNKTPEAAKKFAEVSSAYEVLGDPEKRTQYDQFGEDAFQGGGAPDFGGLDPEEILRHFGFTTKGGKKGGNGGGGFNFSDLFGNGGFEQENDPHQPRQGDHIRLSLTLTFEEAVRGIEKEVAYHARCECASCKGSGLSPGASMKTCKSCHGSGHQVRSNGFFQMMESCRKCGGRGSVNEDPCRKCDGEGHVRQRKEVKVAVPEGADNGLNLRVAHKGHAGVNGGPNGHLFIELRTSTDDLFDRTGADIHLNVPLTLSQAVLGASIRIPTLQGEVEVVIPPGTQAGDTRIIRGKGVKKLNSSEYGNQHLHFKVHIPKSISPKQRELMQQYAEDESKDPPASWVSKLRSWAQKIAK